MQSFDELKLLSLDELRLERQAVLNELYDLQLSGNTDLIAKWSAYEATIMAIIRSKHNG